MKKSIDKRLYTKEEALRYLKSTGEELCRVYEEADSIRREQVGDEVYLRGIIEFSNICKNNCLYCGIRASNENIKRYRMTVDEIMETVHLISEAGMTTVVLQSGEAPGPYDMTIGNIIKRIKKESDLAVTISAGNRPYAVYKYWQECGMDRYLLRFETSDPLLFKNIHPDSTLEERIECLYCLKDMGVQTGSGFMIGIPGESLEVLADNILLCRRLELDMIGIGPFIPHPDTPMGKTKNCYSSDPEVFFKAISVLRIFNPNAHIPATTAYDALFPKGRILALKRGANIFMPNSTPLDYRKEYLLYPDKPGIDEPAIEYIQRAIREIISIGRTVGTGPGHSKRHEGRRT